MESERVVKIMNCGECQMWALQWQIKLYAKWFTLQLYFNRGAIECKIELSIESITYNIYSAPIPVSKQTLRGLLCRPTAKL